MNAEILGTMATPRLDNLSASIAPAMVTPPFPDITLPDAAMPEPFRAFPSARPPEPDRIRAYQQQSAPNERLSLMKDTTSTDSQGGSSQRDESLRPLLEALLAKVDALAGRPIEVSVTSTLDGRKIAEAVYKDLREQRIRNYETL